MNETRTIGQIISEYSARAVEAMQARDEHVGRIRELRSPEGDPYCLDRLTHAQRRQTLAEQKSEQAERDRGALLRARARSSRGSASD